MCGRFDTSHLTWADIHGQLSSFSEHFPVVTAPVILEPEAWGTWLDPAQDAGPLMAAVQAERFEVGV